MNFSIQNFCFLKKQVIREEREKEDDQLKKKIEKREICGENFFKENSVY